MEKDKNLGWFKVDRNIMYDICINTDAITCMVYITLLSHINSNTGNCYPSLNTLAKELNCSKRTIQNKINLLEEAGYIKHNSGTLGKEDGQNLANSYFFLTDDRNDNVDTVAEAMAHKKKKTYKKKDKYDTNDNDLNEELDEDDDNCFDYKQKESYQDDNTVNKIVNEVKYNLLEDWDYTFNNNNYSQEIIDSVNKKLEEIKENI